MTPREGVFQVDGPTTLHHGGKLDRLQIGYSLSGEPGMPVVLALGGISVTRLRSVWASWRGENWRCVFMVPMY